MASSLSVIHHEIWPVRHPAGLDAAYTLLTHRRRYACAFKLNRRKKSSS